MKDFLHGWSLRIIPEVPGYPILGIFPKIYFGNAYSEVMNECFETAKDCGISYSWIGTFPIIYLRDPAMLRQVFINNADGITRVGPNGDGPFSSLHRMIGDVAATADGKDWHRWRTGLLKDFYSPVALKCSYDGILRIAQRHVQKMKTTKEGPDFALPMEAYALDAVWYVTLGIENVSELSNDLPSTLSRVVSIADDMGHYARHGIRNFLSGKSFQEPDHIEQSVRDQIDRVLTKLLDRSRGKLDPERPCIEERKPSFLQRVSQESGGSPEAPVTDDVLAQARQVFTLGHEASAIVLFWAIYELSLHPQVIEKLRLEFQEHGCKYGDPDFNTLQKMAYLDAVVTEIFRMHPPISSTGRLSMKPITVHTRRKDAVIIPRGSVIITSIHLLHHDEQVWGETADDFLPERWFGAHKNKTENRCEYLPFLAGPRSCPSSTFAVLGLKTMLVVLLTHVDIEFLNPEDVQKRVGAVVKSVNPLKYKVHEV